MARVNRLASDGFGAGAAVYAHARPGYPDEIRSWLTGELGLGAGKHAIDLGAGTGKFTPYLAGTGADVTAIEPVQAMRGELHRALPDVTALEGEATAIPLADGSADAVVCAQAFHWFATKETLAEIRRVLKPGGCLGLVWNVRDERVAWVAGLTRIMAPFERETPRYGSGEWRRPFPAEGFSPLREHRFSFGHRGPAERVIVDRVLSVSFIAALPPEKRDRVADQIRALIAATPELAGKDEVVFPYETVAFSYRKLG
jgi:SAM-dependent methyltransferase